MNPHFARNASLFAASAILAIDAISVRSYAQGRLELVPTFLGLSAAAAGCASALLASRSNLDGADRASREASTSFAGVAGILSGAAAMVSSASAVAWAYLFASGFCLLGLGAATYAALRAGRHATIGAFPEAAGRRPSAPSIESRAPDEVVAADAASRAPVEVPRPRAGDAEARAPQAPDAGTSRPDQA